MPPARFAALWVLVLLAAALTIALAAYFDALWVMGVAAMIAVVALRFRK